MEFRGIKRVLRLALVIFSLAGVAACGGEGPGKAADGTGVGPVSGFGSVIVNGVRYNVDNTTFTDAHGRTLGGLAAGMVVKVTAGMIDDNPTSPNGVATKLEVIRLADGPADDNSVSFDNNSFRVMGQTVFVGLTTVFDNVADLFAIDDLVRQGKRPEVEIHGSTDDNGSLRASFVHLWSDDLVPGRDIQLKGTVRNLNRVDNSFAVGPLLQKVDYGGATSIPSALGDGVFVEVLGTYRSSDNVIGAGSIRLEDPSAGQDSGDLAKAEGYVNRVLSDSGVFKRFELVAPDGLQTVNWSSGTLGLFRNGDAGDLKTGAKVQVEGKRNTDKTLAASRITFRKPSNILLLGTVSKPTGSTFNVFGLTVTVNAMTQYKDSSSANVRTFGLNTIQAGDTLRVAAFLDNSAVPERILATRVERIQPVAASPLILQGPVESKGLLDLLFPLDRTLTILGLRVRTTAGSTSFLQVDNTAFPGTGVTQQNNFFDNVTEGFTVVRAQGTLPGTVIPMNASEVRIEPVSTK